MKYSTLSVWKGYFYTHNKQQEGCITRMNNSSVNVSDVIGAGNLGRHETFTPRYGWLKKGYDAASTDGYVFKAEDSIERLGVGKNMVRSIRFWCQAFKLLDTDRSGHMTPTELAARLLADDGWDPYLEDVGSLWLLHWQLFIPHLEAVSWPLAFNKCSLWSFDILQLSQVIMNAAHKYERFLHLSDNSFERDASCLLRMYAEESTTRESEIHCPFTQLGLIHRAEEKNEFSYNNAAKSSLPPLIFAAACLSYIRSYSDTGQKQISLNRLTYDLNSPGIAFRVPESSVGTYLNQAAEQIEAVQIVDSQGTIQLHWEGELGPLYWQALSKYFEEQ